MKKDVIVALLCMAGSIFLYYSLRWIDDERARSFPGVIIIIIGVLSLLLLFQTLAIKKIQAAGKPFPWARFLIMFAVIIVYFFLMETVGFYTSAFLFFITVTMVFSQAGLKLTRILSRAAISAAFTGVIYLLFNVVLKVQTPTGLLF